MCCTFKAYDVIIVQNLNLKAKVTEDKCSGVENGGIKKHKNTYVLS